jgi:hypothetical protein
VEDTVTTYAWLYHNGMSLGTVDHCISMLRYKPKVDLPGGKYPPLLATLGVRANALEDRKIDELSLSFRNQAFAFALVHELGHIPHGHKGYEI